MLTFFFTYANWHYTQALHNFILQIRSILSFLWYFFAIPNLIRTLFSPWRRLHETYQEGFDIQEKFATFLVNSIMRIVGAMIRLIVVVFGLVVQLLATLLLSVAFAVWLLLPAAVGILIVIIFDTLI